MLDRDLAELYDVETRVLNQAVRRNEKRFPADFMFQMSREEMEDWKSQIVISNKERMGFRKPPLVFTEQGVAMLSSVLNSERAIMVNIQIIRVFTKMRELLITLVGKVAIYKGEFPAIFAGYLIRINYKIDILNPIYLSYVLNSETIRNYGFSVMSKSVNQANINGSILKTYKIPLPPLSEQQTIVAEIEAIEAQIAALETEINKIPAEKEAILRKYL